MNKHCIVLASGTGSRFGGDMPKQFVEVNSRMVVEYTLGACDCGLFDDVILVVPQPYVAELASVVRRGNFKTSVKVIAGGASRCESCAKGLSSISDEESYVVIHNGVQPFVKKITLERCLKTLQSYPVAISAIPCVYTVLKVSDNVVTEVPDRQNLFCDMGVEGFRMSALREIIRRASSKIRSANFVGYALALGIGPVGVYEGDAANVKITYPEDIHYAKDRLLRERGA